MRSVFSRFDLGKSARKLIQGIPNLFPVKPDPVPPVVEMPPLPAARKEAYEFYRLEWLPDGYPGRKNHRGVLVPHPIYGTYVIRDYVGLYERNGAPEYLAAAMKVGDAAIHRMEPFKDALVFWYTKEMGLINSGHKIYSGLTQGRYLNAFSELARVSGEARFQEAAERVLASLELSTEDGGVLRPRPNGGAVIEEWPDPSMGNYVLNGWTTAMLMLSTYAKDSGSERAKRLLQRNVIALKEMLHLYDIPDLANSSYKLAGYREINVHLGEVRGRIESASVLVPGEVDAPIAASGSDRWTNFMYTPPDAEVVRANVVLNRVSFPQENSLVFQIHAERAGTAKIEIAQHVYNPLTNGYPNEFLTVADLALQPGLNRVSVPIPWDKAPLVAYPTTFGKKIAGRKFNAYHFIHVNNLKQLGEMAGEPLFVEYAEKWQAYADERWPEMPLYRDADIVLESYSASRQKGRVSAPPLAGSAMPLTVAG